MWHVGLLYRVHDLLVAVAEDEADGRRLHEAFRTFRGVRLQDVLELAERAQWLTHNGQDCLAVTARGRGLLSEPNPILRLRAQVGELMDMLKPTWAAAITQGREALVRYTPPEVTQCFREAGLLDSTAADVVAWWDRRAALYRATRETNLVEIGRIGERLSLAHEFARTGMEARWLSLDYNDSGYDVLSRVSREDGTCLAIEVKTSSQPWSTATFYISRNEWEVLSGQTQSVLHLWCVARQPYQFSLVQIPELARHIAVDQGDGKWQAVACSFRSWQPQDSAAVVDFVSDLAQY